MPRIGIRKVFGASSGSIVRLLSREFLILIAIANLIAWPIAYLATNHWLEDFAYRIDPGWDVFVASGALSLLIALATVSFQAFRAARTSPAEALKCE